VVSFVQYGIISPSTVYVLSRQVGDGQTVRLSLLSFGGRLSPVSDDAIVETPAKTCYEVGAVQVSDARYTRYGFGCFGYVFSV